MTVASDTSVASIFRPASGPRTQADTDKKEGTGSFGMMLDRTTHGDAARTRESRPARDRAADRADRPQEPQKSQESHESKASEDAKNTGDTANTRNAAQAGESKDQPKAQDAQAGQTVEAAVDATVVQDGAALATEATGETIVAAETPTEDTSTDTTDDSEKTDDTSTAAVVVTVAADMTQTPVVAIAADPTAAVVTEATPEGDAEAVGTVKAANTQAPKTEAPNEAAAPVVADAAAKTEGKPDATSETTPDTKPEAKSGAASESTAEAGSAAKPEAKTETKSEAKPEAKPEAKADAKIEDAAPKLAAAEGKPAADDKPEPAIKFSADDGAPKPDAKAAQQVKHPTEVVRDAAADAVVKPTDTTLAAAKAGIESVQNLNMTAPAQPTAAPAQHLNVTATAAAAGAATANNMASNAVPIDGVAVEIAAQSQNGKNSFEIRLDPKELGRIDVRLEVDKDGNVATKLTVERPETLDLLKRDASNIERALQQAGLKTSDNSLQFSLRDQSFTNNGRNDDGRGNANNAQLIVPDDDGMPLETARSNYGRLLGLGRGLDIRI